MPLIVGCCCLIVIVICKNYYVFSCNLRRPMQNRIVLILNSLFAPRQGVGLRYQTWSVLSKIHDESKLMRKTGKNATVTNHAAHGIPIVFRKQLLVPTHDVLGVKHFLTSRIIVFACLVLVSCCPDRFVQVEKHLFAPGTAFFCSQHLYFVNFFNFNSLWHKTFRGRQHTCFLR